MKIVGWLMLFVAFMLMVMQIFFEIRGEYLYEKKTLCYWNLAEKSSTIEKKEEYISKFVTTLPENIDMNGYNAIFLKTLDNSVEKNYEMLKTLQQRLKDIKKMDITSFAYQAAIQQITAQEQGEAIKMLSVFEGNYFLNNYPICWNWIGGITLLFWIILGLTGFVILENAY